MFFCPLSMYPHSQEEGSNAELVPGRNKVYFVAEPRPPACANPGYKLPACLAALLPIRTSRRADCARWKLRVSGMGLLLRCIRASYDAKVVVAPRSRAS
mmetsp:Transcript_150401/g.483364  ORF Transcript_150401/g.483364 Transcript_150401/m.483364 type:complete len:99 (+) Transcript_150401:348-644(+)